MESQSLRNTVSKQLLTLTTFKRIPALESRVFHHPGACFLFISYIWKNVRNMCFHDFSWFSEINGMMPELFCKNVPESLYIENMGTMLPMVTWWVIKFGHLTTLILQCAKRGWPDMTTETLYVEYSYTMTWYEEKTDLTRAWRFLRTNKSYPQKSPFWGCSA